MENTGTKKPISEAKKRADAKWNKENRANVAACMSREEVEQFKRYAAQQGTTTNALIRQYVHQCISELNAATEAPEPPTE